MYWRKLPNYPSQLKLPPFYDAKFVIVAGMAPYGHMPHERSSSEVGLFRQLLEDNGARIRTNDFRCLRNRGVVWLPLRYKFTTGAISALSHLHNSLVFLLWGRDAEPYVNLIDKRHTCYSKEDDVSDWYKLVDWSN